MKDFRLHISARILLFWYLFIFVSTEFLSYNYLLERKYILPLELIFWLGVLVPLRKQIASSIKSIDFRSRSIQIIVLIFVLTFIQGFFSAPNTTDSMVYHIPRVMYWIQEKTLEQDVIRNLHDFMPPFGEYILLHLYFIAGNDRLLFFSQWIAYIVLVIISGAIFYKIAPNKHVSQITSLLVASIPIAVLQATNTKVDMVVTTLVVICAYIAIRFQKDYIWDYVTLGIGLGLGILTKQTFLIYTVVPLGIIIFKLLKREINLSLFLLIPLIIILVLARFTFQNLSLYGSIVGYNNDDLGRPIYTNQNITLSRIFSNLIKNTMLHIPIPIFTKEIEGAIVSLHNLIGIDINDCSTTFCSEGFEFKVVPIIYPQEDVASNPLHLFIIFTGGIVLLGQIIKRKVNRWHFLLYTLALFSYIFFTAVFKWQPFHSRLHAPFFVLGTISSVLILSQFKKGLFLLKGLAYISVSFAILLIFLNFSRPYISYTLFYNNIKSFVPLHSSISIPESFFVKIREKQYFNARFYWYDPYISLISLMAKQNKSGTIAFNLMEGFEYPLWALIKKQDVNLYVVPYSNLKEKTLIFSTTTKPFEKKGYKTICKKTTIEYGYACLSEPEDK